MPEKRKSALKRTRGAAYKLQGLSDKARDIIGIVIATCATILLLVLVAPGSSSFSQQLNYVMRFLFGGGAWLFPLFMYLFCLRFFLRVESGSYAQTITGLVFIFVPILMLLSLTDIEMSIPYKDILSPLPGLSCAGGIVGALASAPFFQFMGKDISFTISISFLCIGFALSGLSFTQLFQKLALMFTSSTKLLSGVYERVLLAKQKHPAVFETREAKAPAQKVRGAQTRTREVAASNTKTTLLPDFLGTRKTTLLTRNKGFAPAPSDSAKTELLRTPHPDIDTDCTRPATLVPFDEGQKDTDLSLSSSVQQNDRMQDRIQDDKPAYDNALADEGVDTASIPQFLQKSKSSRTRKKGQKLVSPLAPAAATPLSASSAPAASASAHPSSPSQTGILPPKATPRPGESDDSYELPDMGLLSSNPKSSQSAATSQELEKTKQRLQLTLQEFGLHSRVVDYVSGPLVTTFRVEMGEGERVNKIRNLEDDIALTLAAEKVRIFAPIPGTSYVGIEIPNTTRQNVHLGDVLPYAHGGPLEVAVGRDSSGRPVITDIAKMPHMLVAGTTGSGKSVMINSMIMSLLMRTTPAQVRLIMIDPKRVEFSAYNGLPHLYVPVVTEPRQAASALQWAVSEMERRLKLFERNCARDIGVYNRMCAEQAEDDAIPSEEALEPLPYLVVIIDELSDLMMVAGKDVEASIVRIAQLARAAGIHLVVATQRPSANVVTGLIKSNIDTRVALKVSSGIDSRVILDETGAERLLGNGDMLFKDRGLVPRRVLGCYTSDSEINAVVDYIRDQAKPDYHEEILSQIVPGELANNDKNDVQDDDPLIWDAAEIVCESQLGSTSGLQRRLKVGYARAGRIMDMLEAKGIVGPPDGSRPREVLMDMKRLQEFKDQDAAYREV